MHLRHSRSISCIDVRTPGFTGLGTALVLGSGVTWIGCFECSAALSYQVGERIYEEKASVACLPVWYVWCVIEVIWIVLGRLPCCHWSKKDFQVASK